MTGNELFGIDIAGIIADATSDGLLPVTVTKQVAAARDPDNLTGGPVRAPATFGGIKGIWEDVPRLPPPGVEIRLNDRVALLIGGTIPAGGLPDRNDAITIAGLTLYVVQLLAQDPANAHYRFLCRDRRGPDGA